MLEDFQNYNRGFLTAGTSNVIWGFIKEFFKGLSKIMFLRKSRSIIVNFFFFNIIAIK